MGDTIDGKVTVVVGQLIELIQFALDGAVRMEKEDPTQKTTVDLVTWEDLILIAKNGADQDVMNLLQMWEKK